MFAHAKGKSIGVIEGKEKGAEVLFHGSSFAAWHKHPSDHLQR